MGEVVELAVQVARRVSLQLGAQRGDPDGAVQAERAQDQLVGADEIRTEPDRRRHPATGSITVSGESQLLDCADVVAVTVAGECIVVEVRGAEPIRPTA